MVGVTMNYRLAPQHRWPSGAEDVGAAIEWLATEIGGYGGDAGRIVVAGHSAGASHVAGFLAGQARTLHGTFAPRSCCPACTTSLQAPLRKG